MHGNMEMQKLGDGIQRSTQITPLKEETVRDWKVKYQKAF